LQFITYKNDPKFWLITIALAHLVFWTLIPVFLHHNAPLDVIEAIAWGQQWQWGYDHDPYLVGWLAYGVSRLAGHSLWPVYCLSQLCILSTFWAIWRLAFSLGLSKEQATLSILLLEGIFYYNFATPEFNDNVLQLPLWALTISFLYTSLITQKFRDWVLTGLWAGLALMAKYYTVMLFFPLVIVILGSKQGRVSFKSKGIYCGILVALIIIFPNLIWQYQHEFQYLGYALNRAAVIKSWHNHWYYPLQFLINQLLVISPVLLLYAWSVRSFRKTRSIPSNFDNVFLTMVTWGPLATTVGYAALTGSHMLSMWGMPLFSFVGLWLVYQLWPDLSQQHMQRIGHGALFSFFIALTLYLGTVILPPYLIGHAKTVSFPSLQLAEEANRLWHQHYEQPLPYVVGARDLAGRVTVYSKNHPVPYFEWSSEASPWVNKESLRRQGAVFVWDARVTGDQVPAEAMQAFPRLQNQVVLDLKWHTRADVRPVRIGFALLPAESTLLSAVNKQ
jgi:4-amino-4-deoxy-L-arabinose transferase-like glycosyltransferase